MEALVVNVFKETIKNIGPSEGKIAFTGSRNLVVSSTWSQRNVERKCMMHSKFVQLVEFDCQEVTDLHASENSTELMTSYSPCFKYRTVFRDVPPSGKQTTKKTHLELWEHNKMLKNLDVSALDLHGDVYTDGEFGCLEWSPGSKKILYTAEKKKKKAEPFLPSPLKPSEDVSYGSEYVMVEDWGETLVGKSSPLLAVWDTEKNEVSVVSPGSSELSIGQGIWAQDGSIVCVGWETLPRRLGKVYCTNRASWLLHITENGNATNLSKDGVSIMSPKFSKDGSKLVWLERDVGGPHHACMRLMKMDWNTKQVSVVVDIIDDFVTTANGEKFFGIFSICLGNCWLSDNKTVVVNSSQRASLRMYAIDTDSKEIWDISGCSSEGEEFSVGMLDVQGDLLLAWKSSLLCTPALLIGRFSKTAAIEWLTLVESEPNVPNYLVDIVRLESNVKPEVAKDFSAIYLGPTNGSQVPLIVFPHGGPHSSSNNSYNMLAAFFAKLGFAVLFINYRGSTGAGEASVKSLLGNVGTIDVSDCHQSVTHVLKKYSNILSADNCVLFGGSHGGFLVLHLSGQYPTLFKSTAVKNPVTDLTAFDGSDIPPSERIQILQEHSCFESGGGFDWLWKFGYPRLSFYKAVSTRNPVVDITSIFPISDIPDWAMVEGGIPYTPTADIEAEKYAALKKMSPISHVDAVTAPTLLLIGKVDLRVPPSQGINYYYALKARGIKTKVLMYEDNHGLPKTPHEVDFAINTILWFLDAIEHEVPPPKNLA